MKDIDALAFNWCYSLRSITLPDGIECIGDSISFGCRAIESLNVSGTVRYIGQYAFACCPASKTMDILYSVESISGSAFTVRLEIDPVWEFY